MKPSHKPQFYMKDLMADHDATYYSFLAKFMCSSLGLKLIFNHIILLTCNKNNVIFKKKQLIFLKDFSKTTNFNHLIS